MRVELLEEEQVYALVDQPHNPPEIKTSEDEISFAEEIQSTYEELVEVLLVYGEEGDFCGQSDFAVRPTLGGRIKPAPSILERNRQLIVVILSERFFRRAYLPTLRHFLWRKAPGYRVWIEQDFNSAWIFTVFLTFNLAQIYCTDSFELARVRDLLERI